LQAEGENDQRFWAPEVSCSVRLADILAIIRYPSILDAVK